MIWYLSFAAWLMSLRGTLSSSIHAVAKIRFPSFSWLRSIPLHTCPNTFASTSLLRGRHLGCFQSLVIGNDAAMNTGARTPFGINVRGSSDKHPVLGFLTCGCTRVSEGLEWQSVASCDFVSSCVEAQSSGIFPGGSETADKPPPQILSKDLCLLSVCPKRPAGQACTECFEPTFALRSACRRRMFPKCSEFLCRSVVPAILCQTRRPWALRGRREGPLGWRMSPSLCHLTQWLFHWLGNRKTHQ